MNQYHGRIAHSFDILVLACAVVFAVVVTSLSAIMGIGQWGMRISAFLASAVFVYWKRQDLVVIGSGTLPTPTIRQYKLATVVCLLALSAAIVLKWLHYQHRPPLFLSS